LQTKKLRTSLIGIQDPVIISLLDFVALLSAFLAVELAVRGHITPGGGFAAGVAGRHISNSINDYWTIK
jgi:multicomponent Na+:H+ antiporter subunit B